MAVALVQYGSSLALVDGATGAQQVLTLPDGVTIDSTKKPSIATLDLGAVIVNSPSRNLMLTSSAALILLAPAKPSSAPTLASGAAGVLVGAYQYAVTFIRKDGSGNVITESAMSALTNSVTLASQKGELTSIPLSADSDTVTGRRLYRTLSGGTVLYLLADIADNTTTTYSDNAADASLSILPENGHRTYEIPGTNAGDTYQLKLVTAWKNRIWGLTDNPRTLDDIYYSEDGLSYRWGTAGANTLVASPKGQESHGVVGFIARRDQLGVGKRSGLWQITGETELSFRIIQISPGRGGLISQPSVVVVNDRAAYLGPDGVNQWDDNGVVSLSDMTVRPWFATDRYFDRTVFANAFAKYNAIRNSYDLHLVEAGESASQVWVAYNFDVKAFYGIHRTGLSGLTCAAYVEDINGVPRVLVGGSDGHVYALDPDTFHDGTATAIAYRVKTPKYVNSNPGSETQWGQVSVVCRPETTGLLLVEATVGRLDASAQTSQMGVDLTQEYGRLRRLGKGTTMQLEFIEESVNQPIAVLGFDVPGLWTTKR